MKYLHSIQTSSSYFLEIFQESSLLWVLIFTFSLLFFGFECGVLLGKKHRSTLGQDDRTPIGSIVAATLGLLAFLLAFTFGITASKFEERRMLVIEEANAIGTTYLRAQYLPEPYKNAIQKLLKEYVEIRLEALEPGKLLQGIKKSEDLQESLWNQTVAMTKTNTSPILEGLFIQSLNEVIDLHTKRVQIGVHFRLPIIVWIILYFVTVLSMGSVGYQIGLFHARYVGITMLLIFTFSSVIVLIVDLDRPQTGFIKVSQQSLVDLTTKFNKNSG